MTRLENRPTPESSSLLEIQEKESSKNDSVSTERVQEGGEAESQSNHSAPAFYASEVRSTKTLSGDSLGMVQTGKEGKGSRSLVEVQAQRTPGLQRTRNNGMVDPIKLGQNTRALIEKVRALGPEQKLIQAQDFHAMLKAVHDCYAQGIYDEHLPPIVQTNHQDEALGRIQEGDYVVMLNFRTDRLRKLTHALVDEDWPHFERLQPGNKKVMTPVPYDAALVGKVETIAETCAVDKPIDEVLWADGTTNFKIADGDKEAHALKFLRGQRDAPYGTEVIRIVPPRKIERDYSEAPEMTYRQITDQVLELADLEAKPVPQGIVSGKVLKAEDGSTPTVEVSATKRNFVINYPIDQVGHSGNFEAAVKSCEHLDRELGRAVEGLLARGYKVLITSDHGNVEMMRYADKQPDGSIKRDRPHSSHTANKVPLILVDPDKPKAKLKSGLTLASVAPTLLHLRGLAQPSEMTGESVLVDEPVPQGGAQKTAVIVLDGFGINPDPEDPYDATKKAKMPYLDQLKRDCPMTELQAAGEEVGLRADAPGNSEVGHMHIGAGRVVKQAILELDDMIESEFGSLGGEQGALAQLMRRAKEEGVRVHITGLASPTGQVHSSTKHLEAMLRTAALVGLEHVFFHAITDGRDSARDSGAKGLAQIQSTMEDIGVGQIVSILGRFWGMDRRKGEGNWERTFRAINMLMSGTDLPEELLSSCCGHHP